MKIIGIGIDIVKKKELNYLLKIKNLFKEYLVKMKF